MQETAVDKNNENILTYLLFCQVGDYWVVYLLSKNLPPVAMKVRDDIRSGQLNVLCNRKFIFQELLDELKPVVSQNKNYGNSAGAYPHLDNLEKDFEKESAM